MTAKGARAADATIGSDTNRGERGAVVSGQFVLKGSVIDVLCASMSTAYPRGVCSGGGGASFGGERNGDLLLVAGGEMKLVLFVLFFGFLGVKIPKSQKQKKKQNTKIKHNKTIKIHKMKNEI